MKILFITDNFPPEVNAPATRTFEHCKEWVENGVEVTVITCTPNFPHGKVYEGYKNKVISKEKVDGIKVIRVWSYISANRGTLRRIVDYVSFAVSSFFAGLFVKTDVIIATSPQFFTTLSGYALSLFKRRPWIFELRDLWPESIVTVGAMKEGRVLGYLRKLEIFLYRKATMIIPNTPAFKKHLIGRGISESKINVVTNGSNLDLFRPMEKDVDLLKKLNLEGKFIVGYIGTHGMAHSLDFIVSSLRYLSDEDIFFLFIGDGAMKKIVIDIAKEDKLNNILFLDPIPKDKIPRYMSLIDAALVPLKKSETFKTVIPSKIFESAAMNKPILLGVEGQAKEIVENYNAGLCFKPESRGEFIDKVQNIKSDEQKYRTYQKGCLALAKDFDRKKLANDMLEYIKQIAERGQ